MLLVVTACGGDGGGGGGLFGDPELEGTWKEACDGRASSQLVVDGAELEFTKTCKNSDGKTVTYWEQGDVYYEIYKVDGTKLYFGNTLTGDGTTAATRPTMLAAGYWYK